MKRLPNFDVRLVEWARTQIGRPFVWGETDCASLVRSAHVALLGRDPFDDIGEWSTKAGAVRALKAAGPLETVLHDAGLRPHPVRFAQTGDVVLFPGKDDGLPRTAIVAAGKLLTTAPGETVTTVSVHAAPADAGAWGFRE